MYVDMLGITTTGWISTVPWTPSLSARTLLAVWQLGTGGQAMRDRNDSSCLRLLKQWINPFLVLFINYLSTTLIVMLVNI